jgi:putative ABC transport system permease protein
MASARQMKILRDLRLHKGRTLLVVLAIAVGLTGAGTVLDKYSLVRQAIGSGYLASNPPAATLLTDRLTPEALAHVRQLPGVRDVEVRRTLSGSIWISGKRHALRLFVADNLAGSRIGRIASESGTWPPAAGELVVERSSLPLVEVATGDEVSVQTTNGTRPTLPVVGLAQDVGLAPGWMEHVVYAYATSSTLAELGEQVYLDELRFTVGDPALDQAGVRRVAATVTRALEQLEVAVREVIVPVPGEHVHSGQMNSLLFVQAALGILALALSGVLVVNLMTAVLAGQVREIGMMKAVGARTSQIAGLYLAMVALMGLAASAIAVPVAAIAGRAYAELTASMLNFDVGDAHLPIWVVSLQVLVGILLPLLTASLPIYGGARMTVAEAIRDHGIEEQLERATIIDRLIGRLHALPRPLLLSVRNTLRRRGRLALTLLTLAAGGALYMGSLNLRASIIQTVGTWFDAMSYDVSVQLAKPYPAAELEQIVARMPGVLRVEAWGRARAALALPDGTRSNAFQVVSPPTESVFAAHPVVHGRWLEEGEPAASRQDGDAPHELVVNTKWIHKVRPVEVGDVLTLWIEGRARRWRVVGIVDSSPTTPIAYASHDALDTEVGVAAEAATVLVSVDPENAGFQSHIEMVRGLDAAAGHELSAAERVHGAGALPPGEGAGDIRVVSADTPRLLEVVLEGAGIQVASSMAVQTARQAMEDHIVLVVNLLWVMSFLVIAVGGFGLATTMSLTVLERTREIGILRSIGASHRSILLIVVTEALAIAFASWVIAVPASLPMSYLLGSAFGRIMFQTPMLFSAAPTAAASWLVFALSLATLAGLWPALRATHLSTREALSRT